MTPSLDSPGVFTVSSVARSPSTVATSIYPRHSTQSLRFRKDSNPHASHDFGGLPSPAIRRKPLPSSASSPLSSTENGRLSLASSNTSVYSVDSPTLSQANDLFTVRDLDRYPHGETPLHTPQHSLSPTTNVTHIVTANAFPPESFKRTRLASQPVIHFRNPELAVHQGRDHKRSLTMALHPPRPPPLRIDLNSRQMSTGSMDYGRQAPKTPGNKITSFFGWKTAASPSTESISTEISDSALSPMPSPMNASTQPSAQSSRFPSRDSFAPHSPKFPPSRTQSAPIDHQMASKLADVESELKDISCELASSIRREMELEDLVERLQSETSIPDVNRRGSDLYSDSGYGSVKYAHSDIGFSKTEDVEKIKRTFEQEKAQLKVELSQKMQDERSRRQAAESHVQMLENQVSQLRREKVEASNASVKTKELEAALEDTRRRLTEERELKDNFEDLLTAMRVELEQHRNERDQLQSRMQQEMQVLRNENNLLSQSRKMVPDAQSPSARFSSIAEEDVDVYVDPSARMPGLSRSNSVARMPPSRPSRLSRSGSLSRPSSIIVGKERDFRETLADRMKDVEMQRDALHQTVKSLLERQAYQARENEKRIKVLEAEIGRSRQSDSPRSRGYERDVTSLREEINILRRRADDALDQKWQCEKGLAGLKMDLDRAEQETTSLRALLLEHATMSKDDGLEMGDMTDFHTTAASLEESYKRLQSSRGDSEDDSENELVSRVLEQVAMNNTLRSRLAQAIGRGEQDQKLSAERINDMQTRLKILEDTLVLAQQQSEDEMAKHEVEISALKETHNAQLLRAKNGVRSPALLSPILPTSPFNGPRSPRLQVTSSGPGIALTQAVHVANLETKVKELEKALRDADKEMEQVVGRMNMAQIEVAELQADRDEALRQTRRLQTQVLNQIKQS